MSIKEKTSTYLATSPFSRKSFTDSDIRDLLSYALDMESLALNLLKEKEKLTAERNAAILEVGKLEDILYGEKS